ncbi:acyl-CoA dehydrogenase family protein [Paenarthrobacter aurescens]|uniref:Dehydrogenase n=1 Tax=Paenarthrobacter aurescens TaxID=43663 RepID=A0A4Y3N7J8_PAEAU|nr:acyl-CoA dehydrogenase family protein [Paenarthrobacter aurescens]MDO6144817.1 acyl-CoA dehydrogenase family protein [Paenarthrobacter aurescens]MDO6148662.1 acyl-CoA dehydrogenase family protein [Paenarthrobacter aurescens]MDO6159908.1 acyl-CoA dehydrogenase family protein [Paenarthrobacter aurescens]MDO6163767.1 acyl-CoA dehydrogenase family protein [Paenarthrobacter aurescens]GEB17522.1 dehydrogenase [Paenarthrobacter aurescens]
MSYSEARPVRISSEPAQLQALEPVLEKVQAAVGDVPALLAIAEDIGRTAPQPGEGNTAKLWELLASVTAVDVAAGRILEPHLDALAILTQAGAQTGTQSGDVREPHGAWGVFAAEGPGMKLEAKRTANGGYVLNGSKPWCSLAAQLDGAVITAHTEENGRAAFAVNLKHQGVTAETPAWTSRGLKEIPSGTVHFEHVEAQPVNQGNWYFKRPGFAWGGMGVAACWLGGAVAVARDYADALTKAAANGREPDQIALASLGEIDRILATTTGYLAQTAERIDAGDLEGSDPDSPSPWPEALRIRGTVAAAVERVQTLVSQNLGPGPLAFDEAYGKRMADLALYIRQHHAMRDDAQLGALALKGDRRW